VKRRQRGFTLTELLILLVAVSVPAFIRASKAGRLNAGVRKVQAAILAARNMAIANNAIYSVEFGRIVEVLGSPPDMDLVATFDDTDNDGSIDDYTLLSNAGVFEPGQRGDFVAVQMEDSPYPPGGSPLPDDYIVRPVAMLPPGVVFAYGSRPVASSESPEWTAMPGWENDDDEEDNLEHFDNAPSSWSTSSNGVPDIAFRPDGSAADVTGETTVVLYDVNEEPDADGNITVARLTVVKYTGELLVETLRAPLSDIQQ